MENGKIGKSNVIHTSFEHGGNFRIGNFCVIEEDVAVGDNVTIGNYVLLKRCTSIGDGTFIDSYVRSSGRNRIGSNCTIRYGATIAKEVWVGDRVFISPNVMTIYSDHKGMFKGGTQIGDDVFIGTAAVIGGGVVLPPKTVIGAMSYMTLSPMYAAVYVGVPAKRIKGVE